MSIGDMINGALLEKVLAAPRSGKRRLVALAGPPASGKSTLAETLCEKLNAAGCKTQVVPMDGFHLDNSILIERGLLPRKGAPETFDAEGFASLIARIKNTSEVFYPTFDRTRDIAVAGTGFVPEDCDTVVVEGNYLLFDAPVWRDLYDLWDIRIQLDVPLQVLEERLIARWLAHGLSPEKANERALANDIPNARRVLAHALSPDIKLSNG